MRGSMKERYTYEIATNGDGTDPWHRTALRDDTFSRDPASVARALLESWIIDHPGELTGGERIHVYDVTSRHPPGDRAGRVRVRVYRGALSSHDVEPAAYGFLGHDERDFRVVATPYDPADRWRRMRASARKVATDRRVGTGVAALVTLLLGYAVSRRLHKRKDTTARPRFRNRRS
jgi:hypothetical protein